MAQRDLDDLIASTFALDDRGRLTASSPALYLLRTRDAAFLRCHASLPDDCVAQLQAITAQPRGRPRDWAREYGAYLAALASVAPITSMRAGPLYSCPPDLAAPAGCVSLRPDNVDLLRGSALEEWLPAAQSGQMLMMAAVEDGRPAALCASVHASAAFHQAGVETAPAWRGRGLAGRAVSARAERVRALGAEPLYGTTFDNLASQTVARRLGLALIGSEFSVEIG